MIRACGWIGAALVTLLCAAYVALTRTEPTLQEF